MEVSRLHPAGGAPAGRLQGGLRVQGRRQGGDQGGRGHPALPLNNQLQTTGEPAPQDEGEGEGPGGRQEEGQRQEGAVPEGGWKEDDFQERGCSLVRAEHQGPHLLHRHHHHLWSGYSSPEICHAFQTDENDERGPDDEDSIDVQEFENAFST